MKAKIFNTSLEPPLQESIRKEAKKSGTIHKVIRASVYWYLFELSPAQREEARNRAEKWVEDHELDEAGEMLAADAGNSASREAGRAKKPRRSRKAG